MTEDHSLKQKAIRWECPFINSYAQCKLNPYNETTCSPADTPFCYMVTNPHGGIYDQFYSNPELRNYQSSTSKAIKGET